METHLKGVYGFNQFREYQKDIISDLINKEDVLAILPTGGSKSLLYQFPATYLVHIEYQANEHQHSKFQTYLITRLLLELS